MRIPRLAGCCLVWLAGCATGPGTSLLPQGHRLLPATKALRQVDPWPLPRELNKQPLPPYTVEPGDTLLLQPADLDSAVRLPGDQPVLPDGTIQLGRYGALQVAGKTLLDVEGMAKTLIEAQVKDAGPITVRLINRQSKVFYVLGEVHSPGAYPLQGRETVLDGLRAAGGLTEQASPRKIILSRPTPPESCRLVLPICYAEIVQHGNTTTNYQLQPGDRIYVATHCFADDLAVLFHKDGPGPCQRPQFPCPSPGDCPTCGPILPTT
jgi:polysaccharide export outer membrane protein